MADKKISQLQAATLPLAGTELLPIVQSGTTDNITVNDLAAGNIKSNATTGVLQVTGPAAASTRVMTTPDANFTAARTDAAQSFTADQTLSTGNLVIGTSGKGIDFSATAQPAGMTSELLADYEEGKFTATLTPSTSGTLPLVASNNTLSYTKMGRVVTVVGVVIVGVISSPVGTSVTLNLPYTAANLTQTSSTAAGSWLFVDAPSYASSLKGFEITTNTAVCRLFIDASTVGQNDQLEFSFSYVAA